MTEDKIIQFPPEQEGATTSYFTNGGGLIFKITFENSVTGAKGYFFTNGIDEILSQEFFNRQIRDAKTNETFTIKEKIIKQLD